MWMKADESNVYPIRQKQKRSLAVETYCSVLGFSTSILSKQVVNVNNLVLSIDKKYLLYSLLLFELLGQKFLYCSIVQLTHSSRIDNNIAGLLCCSFKIALDGRQLIGLWRFNLIQDTINHNVRRLDFVVVANGDKFHNKSMPSKGGRSSARDPTEKYWLE